MVRFISRWLGINYDSCKSCETFRQQLEIANNEKRDLLNTLLDLMRPKVMPQSSIELEPLKPKFASFTRRRSALENSARVAAQARNSPLAAQIERNIEELEAEVGIKEDTNAS